LSNSTLTASPISTACVSTASSQLSASRSSTSPISSANSRANAAIRSLISSLVAIPGSLNSPASRRHAPPEVTSLTLLLQHRPHPGKGPAAPSEPPVAGRLLTNRRAVVREVATQLALDRILFLGQSVPYD